MLGRVIFLISNIPFCGQNKKICAFLVAGFLREMKRAASERSFGAIRTRSGDLTIGKSFLLMVLAGNSALFLTGLFDADRVFTIFATRNECSFELINKL